MGSQRQSIEPEITSEKIRLHEVASQSPSVELGPEEFFVAPYKRMMKLCRRFWGLEPNDFWQNISEDARIEYGHIVEVRNPELSNKPFDTLTGPFKFVDTRILTNQIPLTHPEPTALLRYRSGRRDRLLTLTKLFKVSPESGRPATHRGSIIPDTRNLEKRARWYKKKAHKKIVVSKKPETIADDEIGELIAMAGNAAFGTVDSKNASSSIESADAMVNRWKKREEEKKLVVYESSSDSSVSIKDVNSQTGSMDTKDSDMGDDGKKRSCWKRLCCCCCGKKKERKQTNVLIEASKTLSEDEAYKRRKFLEEKASERRKTINDIWKPNASKVIQMGKGVNAFQSLLQERWVPVTKHRDHLT